jgi:hypothetical protein
MRILLFDCHFVAIVLLALLNAACGDFTKAFFAASAEMESGASGSGVRGAWQIDNIGEAESKCNDTSKFIASISATGSSDFRTPQLVFRPFGVQMPQGELTILSVRVSIFRSVTSNGGVRDDDVSLLLGNLERSDNERSFSSWSRPGMSDRTYTFSAPRLSVADVESSALGLRFVAVDGTGPRLDGDIRIHCVSLAVEYRLNTPRPGPRPSSATPTPTSRSPPTASTGRSSATLPNAPTGSANTTAAKNDAITEPSVMSPGGVDGGVIAAIVLSILCVLICVAVLVILLVQRRKKQQAQDDQQAQAQERNSVAVYLSADDSTPTATPSAYGKVPGRPSGQPMDASNLPLPDAPEDNGMTMTTKSDGELSFFT